MKNSFLRIRDLPKEEQEPFTKWLEGQTRPEILGVAWEDQDGYYRMDYERWKLRLPVLD